MRIFSKIRNSPHSRTHPRSKIRSQKGKQRNHSNFGIKIILVIPPFKFTRFPILPDNPKLLAPLEILRNFRRHISHQSPVNLRTDGKKLGHFELAILHTFLPSVHWSSIPKYACVRLQFNSVGLLTPSLYSNLVAIAIATGTSPASSFLATQQPIFISSNQSLDSSSI